MRILNFTFCHHVLAYGGLDLTRLCHLDPGKFADVMQEGQACTAQRVAGESRSLLQSACASGSRLVGALASARRRPQALGAQSPGFCVVHLLQCTKHLSIMGRVCVAWTLPRPWTFCKQYALGFLEALNDLEPWLALCLKGLDEFDACHILPHAAYIPYGALTPRATCIRPSIQPCANPHQTSSNHAICAQILPCDGYRQLDMSSQRACAVCRRAQ